MPEKKRIRIEKHIGKDADGKKRVVIIKKDRGEEGEEIEWETDEEIDIDALLQDLEEEDENGHTVLKIRIPKIGSTSEGGANPLVRAAGVSGAIENLESEITALVHRAREAGYTWTQIGQALGTSKQAAWERFSNED